MGPARHRRGGFSFAVFSNEHGRRRSKVERNRWRTGSRPAAGRMASRTSRRISPLLILQRMNDAPSACSGQASLATRPAVRGKRFKSEDLPLVRPFSAVPKLLRRVRDAGVRIAVASSAKKNEVDEYLGIARVVDLVDLTTSSDDIEEQSWRRTSSMSFSRSLRLRAPARFVIRDTMRKRLVGRQFARSACSVEA
ncbi:hypothetical protein J2R96_002149 [Bradyrhizobium elkanii]|nr:hypothetical protein [Bradyrhizobium elkanii]